MILLANFIQGWIKLHFVLLCMPKNGNIARKQEMPGKQVYHGGNRLCE